MKLHRMVLTNYRGIAHREIEFPERGVVVISGANEIGKSSMIEALDLLLQAKDRSTKREVKAVKPTHADVGAEVTAEISSGPYRFVYRKQFHKQPQTELTVLAPSRGQFTGDEAHERVLAMLDETVDMEFWRAQRILQSGSMAPVDLSGSDALTRALDAAAGQSVALSGTEPLLVDQIDLEYRQYFTATGRPTSEWLAATKRLERAELDVTACAAAVAEVDDAVTLHGELTEQLARVAIERTAAVDRLDTAQTSSAAVESVGVRLGQARELAAASEAAHDHSVAAVEQRARLRAELAERTTAITALDARVQQAAADRTAADEANGLATAAATAARAAVEQSVARVDAARQVVDAIAHRDEAARLAARLAKLDAARTSLADVQRALATIAVSDQAMKKIEVARAAVERAAMQAELASAHVEVIASADVAVTVDGQSIELEAGATHTVGATTETDVEVPGLVTIRVVPGTPAADSQALLDAATQHLAGLLDGVGVADVAEARAEQERRRALAADRDRLTATCDGLLGDDDVAALRTRLAELQEVATAECTGDAQEARAELAAATAAHRDTTTHAKAAHAAAERAAATAAEHATSWTALSQKLESARGELGSATAELDRQSAAAPDDQLVAAATAHADRAAAATAAVVALAAELAALTPDAVAAELADAQRAAAETVARHEHVGERLRDVTAQLKVYGSEGRQGRLDDAEAERQHAASEYQRLRRRSSAAGLLHEVMNRHRDAARLRYVDPFRREVERLGRIVFGADFEVEIDGALTICSRTLGGRTVPYESLSGGAKEQLGIVARLAGAALVAKEDGVPVVIDDALGFTDTDRLVKMGEVFDAVGGDGQVIVLTCSPDRYAAVGDAHHIELGDPCVELSA